MRNSLLFSVALLGLAGCVNVQKDPPPTTTYVTPANYDVCDSASTASHHYDHHSQSMISSKNYNVGSLPVQW